MTDQQPQQDTIPTNPLTAGLKPFSFQGSASEYFGIWIATLFLTIITLGIYSPWAKVRRLRYFYGHTTFEDRNFDYTAIPFKMLIGRILVILLYIAVIILATSYPSTSFYAMLLVLVLMPWLIHATMRFQARNSKYSNSRFYFSGSRRDIYAVLFGCSLLTICTFGLLYPLSVWLFDRYQFNHLHLGQLGFKFKVKLSSYFRAILIPLLVLVIFSVLLILTVIQGNALEINLTTFEIIGSSLTTFAIFFAAIILFPLIQARLFKAKWSQVALAENDFHCSINQWRYAWIVISNWFARMLSLGLLTPWAAIRLHRYKIENLSLNLVDNPDQLATLAQQQPSAFAEEATSFLDVDISL